MSHYLPAELPGLSNFLLKGQRKSYLLHFLTTMLAKDLGDGHSMVGSNIKAEPLIIVDVLVLDVSSQNLGAAAAYSCFDQLWADFCFLCMGKQQKICFPWGCIWWILHVRTLGDFPPMYYEPLSFIYTKGHSIQRNYRDLIKLFPKSLL